VRWTVHGERPVYSSEWVTVTLADVELPDGRRFPHHVVRMPGAGVAVVVRREHEVLMLWRHRIVTDTWGWEVPAGAVDAGEPPERAAERETLEETGWRPRGLRLLGTYAPMGGRCDQRTHVFAADAADHVGEPEDVHEAERIEWVPVERLPGLLRSGEISEGYTITALAWALWVPPATERVGTAAR
jgi:8-oxo-dGTP pyrophosphatase MutT (NUDIX family)